MSKLAQAWQFIAAQNAMSHSGNCHALKKHAIEASFGVSWLSRMVLSGIIGRSGRVKLAARSKPLTLKRVAMQFQLRLPRRPQLLTGLADVVKFALLLWIGFASPGWAWGAQDSQIQREQAAESKTPLAADKPDPVKRTVGIVKQKPLQGRSVKIADGYMVPYTAKIPGSEIEFTMIPIPGGEFTMGSPSGEEDRNDDEGPQFKVTLKPFWMGKYEVTWAEYRKYMQMDKAFKALQENGLRIVTAENAIDAVTAPSSLYDPSFTFSSGEAPNEPAATMTQFAAKQYTKWLSLTSQAFYRLPTEAEWEYACRAGTTTAFYFGDDASELDKHAWTYESSDDNRHAVGKLKPNPWGLYDMYGNVAEWVLDQYDESGYTHVDEGALVTVDQAFRKPTKLFPRVARGGSFEMEPEECRSAARMASDDKQWKLSDPCFPMSPWWYTDAPATGVGFRLLRPLTAPKDAKSRNAYWEPDIESIQEDANTRIDSEGRGAKAVVDPGLSKDISTIKGRRLKGRR